MINKGTIAAGVILGSTIGAALGVLFAPDKGRRTRKYIKDETLNVVDVIKKDASVIKEELLTSATSGKEALEKEFECFASSASYKTENAIIFLEKQLANLKERNKKLQKTV